MGGGGKVLAHVHKYPPVHNAGAEWMLHALLVRLRDHHGWQPEVVTVHPPVRKDVFQGVPVQLLRDRRQQQRLYLQADLVVTHLDCTRAAMFNARRTRRPLVHLVHNDKQLAFHGVRADTAQLVVFNSRWLADLADWPGSSMIVHPPVWTADYALPDGGPSPDGAVALLNLSAAKGAAVFYELARRMPERQFLAVRGAYAHQVLPPDGLPNVQLLANQADVRNVYRRCSVVLMPSTYESWGRVAVEAGAAGVPCIAAPTPGLCETGVPVAFPPAEDADAWETAVRHLLDNPGAWQRAADHARARALRLEATSAEQVAVLANKLQGLVARR